VGSTSLQRPPVWGEEVLCRSLEKRLLQEETSPAKPKKSPDACPAKSGAGLETRKKCEKTSLPKGGRQGGSETNSGKNILNLSKISPRQQKCHTLPIKRKKKSAFRRFGTSRCVSQGAGGEIGILRFAGGLGSHEKQKSQLRRNPREKQKTGTSFGRPPKML